jgi:hypothetical protein
MNGQPSPLPSSASVVTPLVSPTVVTPVVTGIGLVPGDVVPGEVVPGIEPLVPSPRVTSPGFTPVPPSESSTATSGPHASNANVTTTTPQRDFIPSTYHN